MTSYRVVINDWHPTTTNKLLSSHWSKSRKLKAQDAQMIWAYCNRIPKATGRRQLRVVITLAGRGRPPDPDAYFKSLNDALVKNDLLMDDSMKYLELLPIEIKRGIQKSTEINLTDI